MASSNLRSLTFTVTNRRGARQNTTSLPSNISLKMVLNKSATSDPDFEFVFPFAPIQIEYANLATEWTEIDRPGRTPLVDYSKNKLLQVSFKFLVARPFDGIENTIDNDISVLRSMASSRRTVSFFGGDGMLTRPFQIQGQPTRSTAGYFFNITEFSISSLRRNLSNEITAAECSITLTEVNNPAVNVVQFPAITYPPILPPPKKKPPAGTSGQKKGPTTWQRLVSEELAKSGIFIDPLTVKDVRL